jgi:hypothetical protein
MEPEGSSSHSQKLSTDTHPEPYHPVSSLQGQSYYYPPIYAFVFLVVSSPLAFPPITCTCSSSPFSFYIPFSSHPPWLDHSNYAWWRLQVIKLLLCSPLYPPVTSSVLGPNILLSILFQNTLNLFSCYCQRPSFTPYRTTGKIIVLYILMCMFLDQVSHHTEPQEKLVLYILMCMFLDSRWVDKSFWTE